MQIKRFLVFFFVSYIIGSVVAFSIDLINDIFLQSGFVVLILYIYLPLHILFFGWLYFRKANHNFVRPQWNAIFVWMILMIILDAIELRYLYGYKLSAFLIPSVYSQYVLNFGALVLAARISKQNIQIVPDGMVK
ncbi:MAG: hypothetical protein ACD_76C00149G0006 [uncultured bacterium]|nr:MAG: hypothetical protein ACD_76C00149G0006 [uncultured bacterium]HBD05715.1 hypothetical protein [Candidatus Uhrbacteria bacterium]